jgi:two-component system catabolic regulation response regulator CreB
MSQTILVVEDEEIARNNVKTGLLRDSFDVVEAGSGSAALAALQKGGIDLVLLDVGLPDCCGFQLLHEIRLITPIPVIFMTARDNEQDRVVGLEQGADDYISKPFFLRELIARVRAVLRRSYGPVLTAIELPESPVSDPIPLFMLDEERHQAIILGQAIDLTPGEFGVLQAMSSRPGAFFTRDKLLNFIAKDVEAPTDRIIDTHVKKLRAKMRKVAPDIEFISTKWGFGYCFREIG